MSHVMIVGGTRLGKIIIYDCVVFQQMRGDEDFAVLVLLDYDFSWFLRYDLARYE